jgi:hypothetical protein
VLRTSSTLSKAPPVRTLKRRAPTSTLPPGMVAPSLPSAFRTCDTPMRRCARRPRSSDTRTSRSRMPHTAAVRTPDVAAKRSFSRSARRSSSCAGRAPLASATCTMLTSFELYFSTVSAYSADGSEGRRSVSSRCTSSYFLSASASVSNSTCTVASPSTTRVRTRFTRSSARSRSSIGRATSCSTSFGLAPG